MKDEIKKVARRLRKNQTKAEEVIWDCLRNRKLNGVKFLRQHPIIYHCGNHIRFFVADFYCHEYKFVIEIDGPIHQYTKDRDKAREKIIKELELNVIRFTNDEVLTNISSVLDSLKKMSSQR